MKLLFILLLAIFISGCDLLDSNDIKLKKIEQQSQKDMATLASKKELATIKKETELEKIRLQSQLQKDNIEQTLQLKQQEHEMQMQTYKMLLIALLIIIIAFFIFYYFKKRHENQLKAYEDNLKKYLQQKENDSKNKLAEKLIDTIASGRLDKEQEATLLTALSGQVQQSTPKEEPLQLEDMEAEIEEVKEINK